MQEADVHGFSLDFCLDVSKEVAKLVTGSLSGVICEDEDSDLSPG